MQISINIEETHLQEQIANYIATKQIETNDFMIELLKNFFNTNKRILSNEEIRKIVETSQRIEGYEPVSKEVEEEAKVLMRKYNVQISA